MERCFRVLRREEKKLILAAGLVLLLGAAVVHGLWSDRWSKAEGLGPAMARLESVPLTAGPWKGRQLEVDAEQAEEAARVGIARIVRRQFVHEAEQQTVSMVLMGGRFGPMSVHTPDVCYGAAGYAMLGQPQRVELTCEDGSTAAFWTARFEKPTAPGTPPLRIFWGWNALDSWQAPDNPRWMFRMKAVLYKLYVIREMTSLNDSLERDPALSFLQTWLPTANRMLLDRSRANGPTENSIRSTAEEVQDQKVN